MKASHSLDANHSLDAYSNFHSRKMGHISGVVYGVGAVKYCLKHPQHGSLLRRKGKL